MNSHPVSPSPVGNGESRVGAWVCLARFTAPCYLSYWPSVFMALIWFYCHHVGMKLIQSVSHPSQHLQVGSCRGAIQAQGFIPLLPWGGIQDGCFRPERRVGTIGIKMHWCRVTLFKPVCIS